MSQNTVFTEPPPKPADVPLRVYSNPICPYAQRVRLIVAAKGIKSEEINIHLKQRPEWFYPTLNPHGQVPVIEHEGQIVRESLIAFDYIDEVFGDKSLWPTKPYEKAMAKLLVNDFGNQFTTTLYKLATGGQADETQRTKFSTYLERLENVLKENGGSGFLGGRENPGAVDFLVWPWFERLVALVDSFPDLAAAFTKEKYPQLYSWISRMIENDAVKQSYLPPEAHRAFFKKTKETGKHDYSGTTGRDYVIYAKKEE